MRRWRGVDEERLLEHRLFEISKRTIAAGDEQRDVMVLGAPDWVNIIPVLPDGRLLMIRQWRYGVDDFTLEIPGGMVEDGERHADAAGRELLEETGYRAKWLEELGELHPNPAFQTNRVSSWLASGLEQLHDRPVGDGNEEIEVETYSLEEVPDLMRTGKITHSLVVAAFHLLSLRPSTDEL